jgi:DNA-directed RNA polymerase specialized sigma24 family protein
MPMGTVKNYLFRARKLLKDKLLEKYTEQEFVR